MQNQDGFEQQNSDGEWSPALETGNGLGTWEDNIIVFTMFPITCQGCFESKHASLVKEPVFGANVDLVSKINI